MSRATNITSMAETAEEERTARMRRYALTMGIRMVCVLLLVVVRGPWLWLVAAGAIFLPWIAVVFANHLRQRRQPVVERPHGVVARYQEPVRAEDWRDASTDGERAA